MHLKSMMEKASSFGAKNDLSGEAWGSRNQEI
mgnify:CR=1 FL=1